MVPAHNAGILGSGRSAPLMRNFGARCSASRPGRFTPGKSSTIFTGQVGLWAPEPVWAYRKKKHLSRVGIRAPYQSVPKAVAIRVTPFRLRDK